MSTKAKVPEEKEKKEKKDKEEKKEKKDKEEKKEKKDKDNDDKKEKKEKKTKLQAAGGGFDAWASVGDSTNSFVDQPQDKRTKQEEKEKDIKKNHGQTLVKAVDVVAEDMKKLNEAKKAEKKKKDDEAELKKKVKKDKIEAEGEKERQETFEIMDNSGLGNFMSKAEVLDIMKNTVAEASSSSSSRCQVSTTTKIGDSVFIGKKQVFETLGDFTYVKGFIYIRGPKDEPGFNLRLIRPSTVYVCHSKRPNDDDPWLQNWKELEDSFALPEFDDEKLADIVVARKKDYKSPDNRNVTVPKPPAGLEVVLCFVAPDFAKEPFPAEEATEEELLEQKRAAGAAARANRAGAKEPKKEEATAEEKIEAILEKVAKGEKLNNKEKKLHEKHLEKNKVWTNEEDEHAANTSLGAFTLSLQGGKNEPPAAGDAMVCEEFTLTAPKQTLFDNASLTIAQGKRYGILGPNGQGKTTLLRHLAAREMPIPLNWDVILVEQEAKASDRSAVEEVIAADTTTADLLSREAKLIKELEEAEVAMNEGRDDQWGPEDWEKARRELSDIAASLEASGADSAEARVRKILCGLGFTNGKPDEDRFSMDRPVVQFSGGWRMRISLAKALFLQPKLLMLDEPTNHLDLDAVLWLDQYLSEKYPHAVIVVSHDADFLDSIVTDILLLEDKKLKHFRGDYTNFKKMHNQQRNELDKTYKKQQDELKALKKKGKTKEQAEEIVKNKFNISSLDNLMEKHKDYVVKFNFHGHGKDQSIGGINVTEVAFSYDGKEPWLLDEIEIGVDCASKIAMVGPNGVGKSTLLNLMMEVLEPCQGEVSISKGIRVKQYHQHFEELLPLERDPVDYLSNAFDLSPPEKARAVLGQFGLPGASHFTKIGNLSGGQKARVAFSALMLMKPHIMVLDEPTNHLDIESVEALTDAIKAFNGGLVLVTHDARLITSIDCDIWVVENGGCYKFEHQNGFEGYRDKVLDALEERQAEVERMEVKRREERAKQRSKHVSAEAVKEAKKRQDEEKKKEEAKATAAQEKPKEEAKPKAEEEEPEEQKKPEKKPEKKEKKEKDEPEPSLDFGSKKKKKDKDKEKPAEEEKPAEDAPASKSDGKAKTDLRAELEAMKKGALRKRATAAGVDEDALEEADDEDDPKEAYINLIIAQEGGDDAEEEEEEDTGEAALREELQAMKKGALRKRATAAGVDEDALEEADDEDDAKQAYIELIIAKEVKPSAKDQKKSTKNDDEAAKKEAEKAEAKKKAEEAKKKAEDEAKKKAEEEAKQKADEAKKAKAAEEAKKKQKAASGSDDEDDDDDDDDEDDEDAMLALAMQRKKQAAAKKPEPEQDDEDEEEKPPPTEQPKGTKDDDWSDHDKKKGKNKKGGPAAKAKGKAKAKAKEEKKPWEESDEDGEEAVEDEDNDSGSDHADEAMLIAKTNAKPKKGAAKTKPTKKEKGKSKKDDDDDEEEEAPAPKAKPTKKGKNRKDDDDEEEEVAAPKAKGKKGKKDEEEEEAPAPKAKAKGKKGQQEEEEAPAPKAKSKMGKKRRDDDSEEDTGPVRKKPDKPKQGKEGKEAEKPAEEKPKPKDEEKETTRPSKADKAGGDDEEEEFVVSGVIDSCESMRKKGNFLIMVTAGDKQVQIVSSSEREVGQKVKVALEGAMHNGKKVKREKVAGEWSEGSLI